MALKMSDILNSIDIDEADIKESDIKSNVVIIEETEQPKQSAQDEGLGAEVNMDDEPVQEPQEEEATVHGKDYLPKLHAGIFDCNFVEYITQQDSKYLYVVLAGILFFAIIASTYILKV